MDLNQIVLESLSKIQGEGFIEDTVEKVLKKTLADTIESTLRSYSDFGKQLQEEVKTKLQINLGELDITSYNVIVLNAVKEQLDQAIHIQGIQRIKESMQELLSDVKSEYKLSEVVELMKERAVEYADHEEDGSDISLYVNPHSSLTFIYFDENEGVSEYSCKYRIAVRSDGTVTSATIQDKPFDNNLIMGGLHGFEELLFKLYASGAKLVVDEDDVDRHYPGYYD